jgi:hypothetical protein
MVTLSPRRLAEQPLALRRAPARTSRCSLLGPDQPPLTVSAPAPSRNSALTRNFKLITAGAAFAAPLRRSARLSHRRTVTVNFMAASVSDAHCQPLP